MSKVVKSDYELEYEIFEPKELDTTNNSQIWFAFHGIGQNTEAFLSFARQNNFRVYSFGLFYHEKNQAALRDNLEKIEITRETTLKNWLALMKQFLKNEDINYKNNINIIGFSLGVRPALQFVYNLSKLFSQPVSINKIILIAPETLAISNWYRLGTQTILGNFILKKVVSSNKMKEIILYLSSFLFSKNAQKLIYYQIYNRIDSLASAWLAYRPFEIGKEEWSRISQDYEGKTTILASVNDDFVRLKKIQNFINKNSFDKGKSINWITSKSAHAGLLREFRLENFFLEK